MYFVSKREKKKGPGFYKRRGSVGYTKKIGRGKKLSVYGVKLNDRSGRERERLGRRKKGRWKKNGGRGSTLKK